MFKRIKKCKHDSYFIKDFCDYKYKCSLCGIVANWNYFESSRRSIIYVDG